MVAAILLYLDGVYVDPTPDMITLLVVQTLHYPLALQA